MANTTPAAPLPVPKENKGIDWKKPSVKYGLIGLVAAAAILLLFLLYYFQAGRRSATTEPSVRTVAHPTIPVVAPPVPIPHPVPTPIPTPVPVPTPMPTPVPVLESPGTEADIETIVNYLLRRGTSLDNTRWSDDEVRILEDPTTWIHLTASTSAEGPTFFYPRGIQTTESYEIYYAAAEKKWNLRPAQEVTGNVPVPARGAACEGRSPWSNGYEHIESYKKSRRIVYQVVVHHHHHYH